MNTTFAIVLGLIFGVVFEKYHFCMNSMMADAFLFGDTQRLKGLLAALLASAVGFNLLIGFGIVETAANPLWPTNILAGMIFGVGMVLAGGCISGTFIKMGQGYVASFFAFIGVVLGIGSLVVAMSFVQSLFASFMRGTDVKAEPVAQKTTVPELLGLNPFLFAVLATAVCALGYGAWRLYAGRAKAAPAHTAAGNANRGWSSFVVGGVIVAVLNTIYFGLLAQPLGMAGMMAYGAAGISYLANSSWTLANPAFGLLLKHPRMTIVGSSFLLGCALSALAHRRFRWRLPARRQLISSVVGGFLMGLGTTMMMGCNVTHVLGGLPQFSVGSLIGTSGIVAGAWLGTRLLTRIVARAA
ncbi:MAG: YeeE/YedE family protein [Acidobacteriota bacterium]